MTTSDPRHRRTTRSLRLAVAATAGALALAACGGSDSSSEAASDGATTSTTTDPATASGGGSAVSEAPADSESASTEPPATEPAGTDPAATEPPATEPPGDGGSCLVGNWVLTDAEMASYYDALEANAAGGQIEIDTTGNVLLNITETTYQYVGNFTLELAVAGQIASGDATGTAEGTWTAVDGVLQTELTASNLGVVISINGATIDGSDLANGILQADPLQNAPFSCDGPTIMFQSGATDDIRHPVVLTPA